MKSMSYDLWLKPRSGVVKLEAFMTYFNGRQHYKANNSEVFYENDYTGVYFSFSYNQGEDSNDDEDDPFDEYPVHFNINYFRPDYFILEAEIEVTRLVRHFDLLVNDPQTEGMGEGEYSPQGLFSGWRAGNKFAGTAILQHASTEFHPLHMPATRLRGVWQWNYRHKELEERLGPTYFIPRLMFIDNGGKAATMFVWPDGLPIAAPPADYVCLGREQLAPTRLFKKRQKEIFFVPWSETEGLFRKHGTENSDGSITLNYGPTAFESPFGLPEDVVQFFRSVSANRIEPAGVTPDKVVDSELVAKL
jgi:hypothetical protein